MGSRCKRCVIDSIHGYSHKSCYTCLLKDQGVKVCVVCFCDLNNYSQLCDKCIYTPTVEITNKKRRNYL